MTSAAWQSAPAQDKAKKEVKAAPDQPGHAEVYMAKDGWRFRIKNPEGKSIAIGTIGFEKKEDCLKALDVVKGALTKGKVVEIDGEKK
jgi:uncharacterized protein YegP (UPF0339 family)